MFDLATNPADAPGVDTTQPTDQANEQSGDQDLGLQDGQADDDGQQTDDDTQPQQPELDEVEHDGKKYQIPKDLKPALMLQADYTRKTQELAETRRSIEARQQAIEQTAQMQQAHIQAYGQVAAIDARLSQFQNLNWAQLNAQDPVQAQALLIEQTQLQQARQVAAQQVQQLEQRTTQQRSQLAQQRRMEAAAQAAREIPGWNDELAGAVSSTVMKAYGITADELETVADSRFYRILHDAHQFQVLKAKQAEALKKKPPVAATKPVTAVAAGKSNSRFDPVKSSMDDFATWFHKKQQGS